MIDYTPSHALGAFLRAHREKLTPSAATAGRRRRRTPGWRREELAEACGVSATWITWLEQGRAVSASPAALARLAEVLELTPAERSYLFTLAGKYDPTAMPIPQAQIPNDLLDLPQQMNIPAYLLDYTWTARSWNQPAEVLFSGWLDVGSERNQLRFIFLAPQARQLIHAWQERARRVVAEFRADFSRRPLDLTLQALLDELTQRSLLFQRLWHEQAVLEREGGKRGFHLPEHGLRFYQQTTLQPAMHLECKLVCLKPLDM